jgi:hypothetical protein
VTDDSKALAKAAPERKHWAHAFVERTTGEIEKAAKTPTSIAPYVSRLGSTFGQALTGTALAAGMGTTDALFGKGAGDAVAAGSAGLGLLASVALADAPGPANWAATIGVGSLMCLVRSRTERMIGGSSDASDGGGSKGERRRSQNGESATDRIAAVAAKMGQ